jgi:iron complex outermembrane receptor protein
MSDVEAGYKYKANKLSAGINFYFMSYSDQLILTGQVNDVGEYTRRNIPESSRSGIEVETAFLASEKFSAAFNATFSSNKVKSYSEFTDEYDSLGNYIGQQETGYENSNIAFSPSVISALLLNYSPIKNFTASLQSKYVGSQFLDNTSDEMKKLDAYLVNDMRLNWKVKTNIFKEFSLTLLVNNIFDEQYESNGYTYGYIYAGERIISNNYYPQAGRNFMAGVMMKF